MRLFEQFVEALKNTPQKAYGSSAEVSGVKTSLDPRDTQFIKKEILSRIKDTNLFVMSLSSIFTMEVKKTENTKYGEFTTTCKLSEELDLDVAIPLKTCWFQFPEDPSRNRGIYDKTSKDTIYALFLHEISPHNYLHAFVVQDQTEGFLRFKFGKANFSGNRNHDIWHTISVFLQPFSKDYTGASVKTSARVKYKDPATGEKTQHKLRRVIMIYPKKLTKEDKESSTRENVDFSHRFNVRAHWRRLYFKDGRTDSDGNRLIDFSRIGKNRENEYVVTGHTYVEEGEKGEEHLPFVRKTRVILGPQNDQKTQNP